jgi:hypothetical protein
MMFLIYHKIEEEIKMNSKQIVLKEMFGKNDSYAGYDNICNKLIENGSCISTIYASEVLGMVESTILLSKNLMKMVLT